ncbi:undecaprenyl-phosphate galactose phosphotransferase WbaP [Acidipila sp. EB88]|uniref:undecaprenyl-phosphate galactose phosphotransferase WbaP n=1 Tax=Acidipila sp. EB88 TaxID=2305226 RepID=UPI000F5F452A|nr:undecaprenyl-phosphate galactose phosphotransferase WbaP [Acidipila sp. EB88]RRA47253.1 undecaprenyl-phosphate galactose phosphotransferase WbaP [Acidipila sp. EB88]
MSTVSTLRSPVATSTAIPASGCNRTLTVSALVCADLLAVLFAGCVGLSLRLAFHGEFRPADYFGLLAALPLFFLVFSALDMYPGIAANAIEEFRTMMHAVTISYLLIIVSTFLIKVNNRYSRIAFVLSWLLTLALVPIARRAVRSFGSRQSWWGVPTVIFGANDTGAAMLKILEQQPTLGLRPIALLHEHAPAQRAEHTEGLFTGDFAHAAKLAASNRGCYAILAMPHLRATELEELLNEYSQHFRHVLVLPDVAGMSSLWVSAKDLGGMLGLEVEQRLSQMMPRAIKRTFDLLVTSTIALFLLPLLAVLYCSVRLSSPGPVFYGQRRIGRDHKLFTAWKFRSMVTNADEVLEEHLERDPALRAEWDRDRKLKRDPRVTRIGRIMRKTSLDELPQLWNVLSGQMSLVGPRPIVMAEVERYGRRYQHYRRVTPGITGLWQISGRNNTSYERRTEIDEYYVRNWSVSMDLYILYRTVKTVLFTEGAY